MASLSAWVLTFCGIVLVALSPPQYRWAALLYSVTAVLLFGVSAVYHRFDWSPQTKARYSSSDRASRALFGR